MSNAIYEEMVNAARKARAAPEAADIGIACSDGTVIQRNGDRDRTLAKLHEIISFAEAQATTYQA